MCAIHALCGILTDMRVKLDTKKPEVFADLTLETRKNRTSCWLNIGDSKNIEPLANNSLFGTDPS